MRFEEYERGRWSEYAAFSSTVADIVRAAIETAGGYRLQQVRARAKAAASLRKKLEKLSRTKGVDLLPSDNLEGEIKDLAGCRVIFYTNNDVNQLINSGLIHTNFQVVETKLHHPRRDAGAATELYISNHYIVRLRENRLALPEYASFAGMRCEVQVQTILNHAWAEMAHDTIYKQPDLDTFGTKALEAIKIRMGRIARRYLVPAGYEFAKVSADFERLMAGKELFEGGALRAIVDASDNNDRASALDTFVDGVLPLYNDITAEYPDILDAMIEAAARAKTLPPNPVSTPYGELPAKTSADVVSRIAKVITDYRYVDSASSFDALLTLYSNAQNEEERKSIADAAKRLAEHNLHIWRQYGGAVQIMLVYKISELDEGARGTALPLLVSVLGAVLGTEVTGTTSNSGSVTFHRGVVVPSDALSAMRREATAQLRSLYVLADTDADRSAVLGALHQATRSPNVAVMAPELAETLLEGAAALVEFQASLVPAMSWELLQREERNVLSLARRNRALAADLLARPTVEALHGRTEAAVAAFRAAVAAEVEYGIYKILVGYDVVYPPAWDLGSGLID